MESDIVFVEPELDITVDETLKKIDIQLQVQEITSTSAMIKWRFFASHEKQYIDGAQIR